MKSRILLIAAMSAALCSLNAYAGGADVIEVSKTKSADGTWRFSVTVAHGDEGWEHYANSWQILTPDGDIIATRILAHPHVEEQPFTRNKSGIKIPEDLKEVIVRAGDSVHGFSGKTMRVDMSN